MIKQTARIKSETEKTRISIRYLRKEIKTQIKKQLKNNTSNMQQYENNIQKITNHMISQINMYSQKKEKEITKT